MGKDTLDTKGKILQTAIDSVGLKGEVTIREIAEKAEVNVAAINYYFGNKNNLLKEVENYYSGILYDLQYKVLMNKDLVHREKLIAWGKSLIGFMFEYPALIGVIINVTTEDKTYNPVIIEKIYLNEELEGRVKDIIKEATAIDNERLLDYKYLQMFSSILGPVINTVVGNTFNKGKGKVDIRSEAELEEYLSLVVDSILVK